MSDLPSVGRPGVQPQASAGSPAGVPAIMVPTVGAPTDAPAVTPPAGVSVVRARGELLALMQGDLLALELEEPRRWAPGRLAAALVDLGWSR